MKYIYIHISTTKEEEMSLSKSKGSKYVGDTEEGKGMGNKVTVL